MLSFGGGGGGVGELVGDGGEGGGGVGEGSSRKNPCFINWTRLHEQACATPSLSLKGGEISGLGLGPFLPSFL